MKVLSDMFRVLYSHRLLIKMSIIRDISSRYRGSYMGWIWTIAHPLFLLSVYTFVFSIAFKMRWSGGLEHTYSNFALVLFAGMLVHSMFTEALTRAPGVIVSNVNYVKKVVYPLEILPVVIVGGALFHMAISTLILLVAIYTVTGTLAWTAVFLPLVFFPLTVLTVGISWILASLGVFLRDIGQLVNLLTSVLLFLTPVFYPLSSIPEKYQPLMLLNPLTFVIEQSRALVLWGELPDWQGLGVYYVVAIVIAVAGFWWFQSTRKGFADVL